ncbi:hypothetical protein CDEF62S_02377 [Castellaniella defragrans]
MATLPKGIRAITAKAKDGRKITYYQYRKNTKKIQSEKCFPTLREAIAHKEQIEGIQLLKDRDIEFHDDKNKSFENLIAGLDSLADDPELNYVLNNYEEKNLNIQKRNSKRDITKENIRNDIYRLRKTLSTYIDLSQITKNYLKAESHTLKKLGQFKLSELKPDIITEYINVRIKDGRAKSTIEKELTTLNTMLNNVEELHNISYTSPINQARKTALKKIKTRKRNAYLSKEDKDYLKSELEQKKNKRLRDFILLSLYTSLRRSEILDLKWSDIREDYIELGFTKNGEERDVWLNKEAKEVLKGIDKVKGQDRVFDYSLYGFRSAFQRFQRQLKIDVNFHDFRKAYITETIQKQLEATGKSNVSGLAAVLGIVDEDHFAKIVEKEEQRFKHKQRNKQGYIEDEKDLMANSGHKDYRTQKIYITKLTMPK